MTFRNRTLVRKPVAMLRANEQEEADLDFLVDAYGGGSPSEIYRQVLLKEAAAKRRELNPLAPCRLDNSPFSALRAA